MVRDRYVLLGVAPARSDWFRRVGQWSTTAAIPAEFLRCVSGPEVHARLASGRPFSAVIADAGLSGLDRDLVAATVATGIPVIVVDDGRGRDWEELGVVAVLPAFFDRESLLECLSSHTRMVGAAVVPETTVAPSSPAGARDGAVIAVTGPGGTGASTVAIALAQGLARAGRGDVLLADLCRAADQAMLHDSRVVVPSVQEVVEAHRGPTPAPRDVRDQTFEIDGRGYRLLLGLRRAQLWNLIRAQAFEATLDSLQRAFDLVVCDIDPDVEGEEETGSGGVEDRHLMARATAARASAVLVVGHPGMKGLHALVRVTLDLLRLGVPASRLLPVILPAPRSPRERADLTTSLATLASAALGTAARSLPSPLYLPRRAVDDALRDGLPLPKPLPDLLAGATTAMLDRSGARTFVPSGPVPVRPGSLGLFTSQEGTA
jgi:hypothetical protein